LQRKVHSQKR